MLDTGAGPNLVKAACLPEEFVANANRNREIVNLSSASSHLLNRNPRVTRRGTDSQATLCSRQGIRC